MPIAEFLPVGDAGDEPQLELGFTVKNTAMVTAAMAIPFIIFALYVKSLLVVQAFLELLYSLFLDTLRFLVKFQ